MPADAQIASRHRQTRSLGHMHEQQRNSMSERPCRAPSWTDTTQAICNDAALEILQAPQQTRQSYFIKGSFSLRGPAMSRARKYRCATPMANGWPTFHPVETNESSQWMSAHKIVHHLETVFFELWRLIHGKSLQVFWQFPIN